MAKYDEEMYFGLSINYLTTIASAILGILLSLITTLISKLSILEFLLADIILFYLIGGFITCILIILGKIEYDKKRNLSLLDWYTHHRFWSFFLWFNFLFWIYLIIKYLVNILRKIKDPRLDFKEERFYAFAYFMLLYILLLYLSCNSNILPKYTLIWLH